MAPFKSYEVQFSHQEMHLVGSLLLPPPPGPHPALVMLQGSGATDRDNFGYFPAIREHFAQHGIAVLCYDKPGTGTSSGNWKHQSGADRASEALAALRVLQAHPQIVPHQVGLWGISQGGWIAPLAASRSNDVAFIIPVSGPGVSPAEQERYGLAQRSHAHGFAEHDIAQALVLYDALVQAARRDASFDDVTTLITQGRTPAWDAYMGDLDAEVWQFLKRAIDYDPVPALERVTCPVLAIFGEHDVLVPVAQSVRVFEQALTRAGNPDVTIRVFPHADHAIEVGTPPTFAPDYLDTMVQWIWQRFPTLRRPR